MKLEVREHRFEVTIRTKSFICGVRFLREKFFQIKEKKRWNAFVGCSCAAFVVMFTKNEKHVGRTQAQRFSEKFETNLP